jgi:hypothetical protein
MTLILRLLAAFLVAHQFSPYTPDGRATGRTSFSFTEGLKRWVSYEEVDLADCDSPCTPRGELSCYFAPY